MVLYRFFRAILIVFCKLFFQLEAQGKEFVPRRGGFVLASNHASFLDPIILGTVCPRILNFAAKESLFRNKLFAALLFEVGAFPIKRWSADLAAVRESVRRLSSGVGLVVFPEGTRSVSAQTQNITYGFVLLARKAGVPVVPAWICGSDKAWGKGSKMIRPVRIRVIFGRPIYPDSIAKDGANAVCARDYEGIAQDIFKQIKLLGSRMKQIRVTILRASRRDAKAVTYIRDVLDSHMAIVVKIKPRL